MLLGIDVGGTFTDAVILEQGEIAAQAKRATTHDDVLHCVLAALDAVLKPELAAKLERVVISSTIVTNALTEGRLDEVFLAVIAGPGMNIEYAEFVRRTKFSSPLRPLPRKIFL